MGMVVMVVFGIILVVVSVFMVVVVVVVVGRWSFWLWFGGYRGYISGGFDGDGGGCAVLGGVHKGDCWISYSGWLYESQEVHMIFKGFVQEGL